MGKYWNPSIPGYILISWVNGKNWKPFSSQKINKVQKGDCPNGWHNMNKSIINGTITYQSSNRCLSGWVMLHFFYYTYMRITLIKKYIRNTLVNILENLHLNWMILIIWCEKYIYRFFFWRRNFEIFFSKIHQDQNWKYEDHDRNSHSARHGRLDVF